MIAKTGVMLFILFGAALVAAAGVWFGVKAYRGWMVAEGTAGSEWTILGSILSASCFGVLVKLAYQIASAI